MKKNSIFSFKLYREALRQIRVCAIVPLVFMFLALGISFAESCIEAVQNPQIGQNVAEPMQINPLLVMTFLLCAPLLTFVLFNFLNKRNQSDFYHAIPQPRQCVAVSFLAAIFTWIVIYAVVPTLCGAMLYRFFLFKQLTVDMSLLLSGMLNVIVLSALIVAAIFLAMTVTGTLFSNGIVALLILFLPRFFMTIVNAAFSYDIIPASSLAFPFGPFNMLFNLFFGASMGGDYGLYPFNGWALLYTSVLAILYLALGLFLFKRRPSEAAGNPAPSRKMQALHRIVLTCAVAFPLTLLFISEPPNTPEGILLYVVGFIVAIIVYFMYELLSTRTVRYMVKIIPGLLIVAVACIAGVFLSKGFYGILLNDVPKADEVKCIYIEKLGDRYEVEYGNEVFDYNAHYYFDEKVGELEFTDKECIRITTESLDLIVKQLKEDPKAAVSPSEHWAKIKFVCKNGHEVTRLFPIFPNVEDFTTLQNALKAHPDYKKVYTNLPAFKDSFATALWGNSASDIFTIDQRRDLYNTLRDELKTVDADKWVAIFTGDDNSAASYDCPAFLTLEVSIPQNGKTMVMQLPICTLTPKTLESAQKIIYANFQPEDFKKAMRLPDSYGINEFNSMNWIIRLSLYQDSGVTERLEFSPSQLMYTNDGEKVEMTAEEKAAKIKKWNDAIDYFAAHNTPAFDMTNGCVEIWAEYYVFNGIGKGYEGAVFLPLDGDTLPKELFGLADFLEYSTNIYGEEIVKDGETVENTELPADFGSTTATATATLVSEQTQPAA